MDWLQLILSGQAQQLGFGQISLRVDALTVFSSLPFVVQAPALLLSASADAINKKALFDWLVPALLWPTAGIAFARWNLAELANDFGGAHLQLLQWASVAIMLALFINFAAICLRWPPSAWRWQVFLALLLALHLLAANADVLLLLLWTNLASSLLAWLLAPPVAKTRAAYTAAIAYFTGMLLALAAAGDVIAALAELAIFAAAKDATSVTPAAHLLANALRPVPAAAWLVLAWLIAAFAALAVGSDIRAYGQAQRLGLPQRLLWRLKPRLPAVVSYKKRAAGQLALAVLLALWLFLAQT